MQRRSTRHPRIIDIRAVTDGVSLVLGQVNSTTCIFRTQRALTEVFHSLERSPSPKLRVLQVGIGADFAGETVDIIDMLESTKRGYELVCMDSDMAVVLKHSMQDQFETSSLTYAYSFNPVQLRALIHTLAWVTNIRETPDEVCPPAVTFSFDIPPEILDRVSYVVGRIERDRLPAELIGFDAVICFQTLRYLEEDPVPLLQALQNMRSYLLPHGVLALNAPGYPLFNPHVESSLGFRRIYGPDNSSGTLLDPRLFELA